MALVPLAAGQLGEPVPPLLPILRWSPDARPRPTRAHGTAMPQPDGLHDLLAMIAATRRVDPLLLRAMRRLNPRAPLNAGLEGAAWCHADVKAVHTASIRTEAREAHLRHFADWRQDLHAELDRQRSRHHSHLRAVLTHEETLLWAACVGEEAVTQSAGAATRIENARDFMRRLVATLTLPGVRPFLNWWSVAHGIVQRADERMWKRYGDELHRLLAPQVRVQGADAVIPEHADPAALAGATRHRPIRHVMLAGAGRLERLPATAGRAHRRPPEPLGEAIAVDAGGSVADGPVRWLTTAALPIRLGPLSEPTELHIETARESILVAPIGRPRGAFGWGCDRSGITVRSAEFGEWHPFGQWNFPWSEITSRAVPPPPGTPASAPWALEADGEPRRRSNGEIQFGIDRRFGDYVDLTTGEARTRYGAGGPKKEEAPRSEQAAGGGGVTAARRA